MNKRIPLQVVEGRLVLTSVIESAKLRIPRQIMEFVLDTGSQNSYLGYLDVRRLQISTSDKSSDKEINFGGSRFKQIPIPKLKMHLLTDDKSTALSLDVQISALKTTKTSTKNIQIAEQLPSILGMDFLKEQKLSLHVILSEDLAYLECNE